MLAIARGTGSDRKTVAKYVAAAQAAGLQRGETGPTDAQVAVVLAAVRPTTGGRPRDVPDRLAAHQAQIAPWLAEGLRLTKIHRRQRALGVTVPYSSLHRFAQAHLAFGAPTMTVRVAEPPPGEAAEIDFGVLGLWCDPLHARQRRVYGLLVTLCFSRYAFLAITLGQDLAAVLDGLESAWVFFGGGQAAGRGQSQACRHPRRSLRARHRPRVPGVRAVSWLRRGVRRYGGGRR